MEHLGNVGNKIKLNIYDGDQPVCQCLTCKQVWYSEAFLVGLKAQSVIKFIEDNELGYILGNAVRAIIYTKNSITEVEKIQHLKDARQFLNVEIKRLSKKEKTTK